MPRHFQRDFLVQILKCRPASLPSTKGVRMRRTLGLFIALISSLAAANPVQTFSQGSLIIPMQANFQSACGTTSAYGLIWKLLYENRPGGAFAGSPVTIYWVINDAKDSPNRCVPSNKHASPLPSSISAGATGWDNAASNPWSDGCDLTIPNGTGAENVSTMPVVPVMYATGTSYPATNMYPTTNAIIEYNTTGGISQPSYNTAAASAGKGQRPATLDNSGTCASPPCGTSRFTKIQYSGGVFVIDATDAKRVILAMQNTSYPHLNLHTDNVTTCGFGGGSTYRVNMHMSTIAFDAPIYKRMTNVPPKIALLDFGAGIKTVLTSYLQRAGLTGTIAGQPVAGTPSAGSSGLVYDRLRAIDDLVSTGSNPKGFLNSKVGSKSRYKVFWAPHWQAVNASLLTRGGCTPPGGSNNCDANGNTLSGAKCGGGCDASNAEIQNALDNIAYFADQKGNGLMAECASIEAYEGSANNYGCSGRGCTCNALTCPSPNNTAVASLSTLTQFQFENSSNAQRTIVHNGLSQLRGRNCTDPDYMAAPAATRGNCTRYTEAGDPFSQVGDFAFGPDTGAVETYRMSPGGSRRAGVKRLATSSASPAGADNTGDNGFDFFTLNQKDNDPEKATIVYIGGHDLSGNVAGTRVVLNTLLNLGADPVASDRNFAQGVGWVDATNSNTPTLFSSIYQAVSGTLPPGSITYTAVNGKNWLFPFTRGNVRARAADTGLVNGINELNDALIWNADGEMPLPANRNLFTYFGGVNSTPSLSGGRTVRNNVAQTGWVPESIEQARINSSYGTAPNPNCVDVLKYGDYKDKVSGNNTGGLVAGPDGICDLQEGLMWSSFTWGGGGGGPPTVPPGHLMQLVADVPELKRFLSIVRGYCWAEDLFGNPIYAPTDAECVSSGSVGDNRARMGGAVRSSIAIATASSKVASAVDRPTVAYVGTWDGQLHAIYVGGGSGYTGPTETRQYLNAEAASRFKTNWSPIFAAGSSLPNRGTELWSFLPASQLPFLRGNNARVDSTPVVQDVFVDLYGDGIRRWHTILVASIGGTGREIFAFDVSNPLRPVLLWDIIGSNAQISGFPDFAAVGRSDWDVTGAARPLEWDNTTTNYILPPLTDTGRSFGAAYDYSDLGGSKGLAIGQMREGLEPTYAVFVASSSSGYGAASNDALGRSMTKGIVVHAIDIATGQKLWKWKHPYVNDSGATGYRMADNSVPANVTVRGGTEGASIVYIGDMEGRLWELDASTGQSLTAFRDSGTCTGPACNFAAFDTLKTPGTSSTPPLPQPITSNINITRMPSTATGPLANYVNEDIAVFATAGADWVPCNPDCNTPTSVAGKVHTILLGKTLRKPVSADSSPFQLDGTTPWTTTNAISSAQTLVSSDFGGLLQEPPGMPLSLTGANRVYGNIVISGQWAYVPVVQGQGGDPMNLSKTLAGKMLLMDLGGAMTSEASTTFNASSFNFASFGGAVVMHIDVGGGNYKSIVMADEVGKTAKYSPTPGPPTAGSPNRQLASERSLPYRLYNTVRRFFSQQ